MDQDALSTLYHEIPIFLLWLQSVDGWSMIHWPYDFKVVNILLVGDILGPVKGVVGLILNTFLGFRGAYKDRVL